MSLFIFLTVLQGIIAAALVGVTYEGAQYDYIGHISRDQYQGVMLGYALAYEALGEAYVGKIAKQIQVAARIG